MPNGLADPSKVGGMGKFTRLSFFHERLFGCDKSKMNFKVHTEYLFLLLYVFKLLI
jgi:hypothetical protein